MSKIINIINCGLGGFLVAKFANELNTPQGIVFFISGATLLAISSYLLIKE